MPSAFSYSNTQVTVSRHLLLAKSQATVTPCRQAQTTMQEETTKQEAQGGTSATRTAQGLGGTSATHFGALVRHLQMAGSGDTPTVMQTPSATDITPTPVLLSTTTGSRQRTHDDHIVNIRLNQGSSRQRTHDDHIVNIRLGQGSSRRRCPLATSGSSRKLKSSF